MPLIKSEQTVRVMSLSHFKMVVVLDLPKPDRKFDTVAGLLL